MMKENFINTFLTDNITQQISPEFPLTHNKTVGGCSKRRPDWFIDMGTHIVVIECDENQHFNYSCENKRMMELFQDFGNRPIIFIRFNPDKCIERPIECFGYTESNVIFANEKEWSFRSKVLLEKIKEHLTVIPEKECTIEYLFFNPEQEEEDDEIDDDEIEELELDEEGEFSDIDEGEDIEEDNLDEIEGDE